MKRSKIIEEMNMEDIINRVGLPTNIDDIRATYKNDADINDIFRFENKIDLININIEDLMYAFIRNEEIFDKDLYIFHLARLIEKNDEKQKKYNFLNANFKSLVINVKDIDYGENKIEYAKMLIQDMDIIDVWLKRQNNTYTIEYETSLHFVNKEDILLKRDKLNNKIFNLIDSKIGLKAILKFLKPSDLLYISIYPNLGNLLSRYLYKNKKNNRAIEYEDKVLGIKKYISTDKLNEDNFEIFSWNEFEKIVRKYIRFIDLDKMLLLSLAVFYNKYGQNFYKFTTEEIDILYKYMNNIEKLFKQRNPEIYIPMRFPINITFDLMKKLINELKSNFVGGKFCSSEMIETMKKDLISGKQKISTISKIEFETHFDFKTREIVEIINNDIDAYTYIYENNLLDDSDLELITSLQDTIYFKQLYTMIVNNKVTIEKLKRYYFSNKISYNTLIQVEELLNKNNTETDISLIISNNDIVDAFLYSYEKDKFDKVKDLYLHSISFKNDEEKNKDGKELLNSNEKLKDKDNLIKLYQMKFITLENLIETINDNNYQKLFENNILKHSDILKLININKYDVNDITEVLKRNDISLLKKNILLYSLFSNIEDNIKRKEIIENIIKCDNYNKEDFYFENENISIRWRTIALVDPEYSMNILENGYILYYLPNKHVYLIEKICDLIGKISYGTCTYIISEKVYRRNEKILLNKENNEIKEYVLYNLYDDKYYTENKLVSKIFNVEFNDGIGRFFDINLKKDDFDEEIEEIEKINKKIIAKNDY